jgi:putative ABC transport system permease protein
MISYLEMITSFEMGLIYSVAAIGIFLTFRVIDFADLTCDGSFVLGAVVSAVLIKAGCHPVLALLAAAGAGGLAGLCTGLIHLYFKISALLAGILVAFMLYSVNLKIMSGIPNIALINLPTIFNAGLLGLIVVVALIVLGLSLLLISDFGLSLRSLGQNKRLAFNCGVNISAVTLIGLLASNALIAVGGSLFSQHQGFADVSQGAGTIIICFASLMIGEKLLPSSAMWLKLLSCVAGALIYRLLIALALHSEWLMLPTEDLNLLTGLLVMAFMRLPALKLGSK